MINLGVLVVNSTDEVITGKFLINFKLLRLFSVTSLFHCFLQIVKLFQFLRLLFTIIKNCFLKK